MCYLLPAGTLPDPHHAASSLAKTLGSAESSQTAAELMGEGVRVQILMLFSGSAHFFAPPHLLALPSTPTCPSPPDVRVCLGDESSG